MSIVHENLERQIIPFSECQMCIGEAGQAYIVHLPTQRAFMSRLSLAKIADIDRSIITRLFSIRVTFDYPKQLQTLLRGRLIRVTEIENPGSGSNFQCLDAKDAWAVLNYAANFSQGHEKRLQAKLNLAVIGEAGMTAFIYTQAEFTLEPVSNIAEDTTTSNGRVLVGTWESERLAGIEPRKAFNSLCKQLNKNYDKYTNRCYSALFACTADTLRKTRETVSGKSKIGRNHIAEPVEIQAVTRLEELLVLNYEVGMSLSRMIIWYAAIVLAELGLPQPNRKRQSEWRQMLEDRETSVKRLQGVIIADIDKNKEDY